MKRVRLYELAKELRLESRQVVVDARRLGAMVNSPSSSVDEKTADRIRELYYPKKPAATEHRAARLVKTHKPAATPVETPKAPAAERKPEDQAVQKPAHSAPEAAAEPQAGARGSRRVAASAADGGRDGARIRREARHQTERRRGVAATTWGDGDDQSATRSPRRARRRAPLRLRGLLRQLRRSDRRIRIRGRARNDGGHREPGARSDRDGARRSRQDQSARRHSGVARGRRRGGRDHAANRRLFGRSAEPRQPV